MSKVLVSALFGLVTVGSVMLIAPNKAQATPKSQVPELPATMQAGAPAKGVVMIQDNFNVYLYDGSEKKVVIISKNSFDEDGKPIIHITNIAKPN